MKIASLSDVPDNGAHIVETDDGRTIAIFNCDGEIFAINNTCLHKGGPLGEGEVEDGVVTCPWHGWQYELKTGKCLTTPGKEIGCYPVHIHDGEIHLS